MSRSQHWKIVISVTDEPRLDEKFITEEDIRRHLDMIDPEAGVTIAVQSVELVMVKRI